MNIIIKIHLSSQYSIKIFDDHLIVWYCTPVTLYFMRKIIFSLLASSTLIGTTFAYTMQCPSSSSCDQCFGFTLGSVNSSSDEFHPRANKKEQIDLANSTISAQTFQWASVTPIGNIKSSYTLDGGPNTTKWNWATMNGSLIKKGTIPNSIDYTLPVYQITYTTDSYTVDSNNQKESWTNVAHVECAYFYVDEPTSQGVDGKCSSITNDTYVTNNPKSSSLSGKTLCSKGNASTVKYSAANEQWSYTCSGASGGDSASCTVDLEPLTSSNPDCTIEVTDTRGTVPFSTSISCYGEPQGKVAISISKGGSILDAIDSDTASYDFNDSGTYTISCFPDVVNDRTNVCKKTVTVSGDCGNGIEESDEQCDDGNRTSGDGCNNACQLEWAGGAVCGNNIKEKWEQCDDGNLDDGDTCTSICQNTAPNTGPIEMLSILLFLSLGGTGYYFYRKRKIVA